MKRTRRETLSPEQVVSVQQTPLNVQEAMKKAYAGECSPILAIKMKCIECCGCEDYISRVRECGITRCPLWAYRPYQENEVISDD